MHFKRCLCWTIGWGGGIEGYLANESIPIVVWSIVVGNYIIVKNIIINYIPRKQKTFRWEAF